MITLRDLKFGYHSSKPLLSGLNIEVERGVICGLLGKNGVGKTTLLHLISGMLKPNDINSVDVLGHTPFRRTVAFLSTIFLVPEEFELPRISILKYASIYGKFYPKFSLELLKDVLQEMEVDCTQSMNIMSFGQRKKAYIAFAIACNTDILLLDEPTNGLDITSKAAFRRAMARFADDNRTVIISTHQVRDLEEILDTIIILDNNEVLLHQSVSDITKKLRFEIVDATTPALYKQPTIHGVLGVVEQDGSKDETQLDIELLFGATIESPEEIHRIFNS